MGRIEKKEEQTEEGKLRKKMAEHAQREVFLGFRRIRDRNRQLETEAQAVPGAEILLPELKEIESAIDQKEQEARDGMRE
jgi:hypothetical protein